MRTDQAQPVRLADYRVPDYLIDTVALDVHLDRHERSCAPASRSAQSGGAPRRAAGARRRRAGAGARACSMARRSPPTPISRRPSSSPCSRRRPKPFVLEIETRARPGRQPQADGPLPLRQRLLHAVRGGGLPPHHLLPRPARRAERLHRRGSRPRGRGAGAAVQRQPGDAGAVEGTDRHFAVWHDPHPKPCYLFALVGGDLGDARGPLPHGDRARRRASASTSSPARRIAPATPWTP